MDLEHNCGNIAKWTYYHEEYSSDLGNIIFKRTVQNSSYWEVYIDFVSVLVTSDNEPLPGPMFIGIYVPIWRHNAKRSYNESWYAGD